MQACIGLGVRDGRLVNELTSDFVVLSDIRPVTYLHLDAILGYNILNTRLVQGLIESLVVDSRPWYDGRRMAGT